MMHLPFAKTTRPSVLRAAWAIVAMLVLVGIAYPEPWTTSGMGQSTRTKDPAASTPVAAKPGADASVGGQSEGDRPTADPLDGDPLDGAPPAADRAEEDLVQYDITRSGRPESAPSSVVAYDDDPATVWAPDQDGGESWLWFDLGDDRELRQIRWLARGSGSIEVAISADRRDWEPIAEVDARRTWQESELDEEARYVRLALTPNEDGVLPQIAEVEVYGEEVRADASSEQKAKKNRRDKRDRRERDRGNRDDNADSNEERSDRGDRRANRDRGDRNRDRDRDSQTDESQDGVSVQAGETDCRGDRARCRARPGSADMENECGEGGTCTIDVNVDGGSATCDAVAGDENRAGRGRGRRAGDGGRCEAVADGGAVTIGDINP